MFLLAAGLTILILTGFLRLSASEDVVGQTTEPTPAAAAQTEPGTESIDSISKTIEKGVKGVSAFAESVSEREIITRETTSRTETTARTTEPETTEMQKATEPETTVNQQKEKIRQTEPATTVNQQKEKIRQTEPATTRSSRIEIGDCYGTITVEGCGISNVNLYYGSEQSIIAKGAGTFHVMDGVGIPGQGKTSFIMSHNDGWFSGLRYARVGGRVTIRTFYGTYIYQIRQMKVVHNEDRSAYDLSRTDENLILYTCYPFVNCPKNTPYRYMVFADLISGP